MDPSLESIARRVMDAALNGKHWAIELIAEMEESEERRREPLLAMLPDYLRPVGEKMETAELDEFVTFHLVNADGD